MKKLLIITALIMFVSTSAYAASSTTQDVTLTSKATTGKTLYGDPATASASTSLIGKTSTGVGLGIITSVLGYSIVTQHLNGTKVYGTSYDSTSMFAKTVGTVGTVELAKPSDIATTSFLATGWSSL